MRIRVESALAGRVATPFEYRDRRIAETVPAGVPSLDAMTGGLPRGSLTEIYGPPCSGRTSFLISTLASRTAASEVCALVDAGDAFDPYSAGAAGVRLQQLLWVRCRNADQALRSADLLIQGGGFGLIALDLSDVPPQVVRGVPLQVWFRFRRAVESTPTIFVLLGQESNAKTCASLVLRMQARATRWSQTPESAGESAGKIIVPHSPGCLLGGWTSHAEMIRAHRKLEDHQPVQQDAAFADAHGCGADFEARIVWKA
ncbi:MAG: DNA recombination/repair protein RecA [Acidobacteriia bacterium]|nr:DNA recombination/repair protein RecA [Terriglobia bacterium]